MNPNFRIQLRRVLHRVENERVGTAKSAYVAIKNLLAEEGLDKDCYLGVDMQDGDDICVRWYAGQFLSIVDQQAWFAMNSLLNCMDRFCPLDTPSKQEV